MPERKHFEPMSLQETVEKVQNQKQQLDVQCPVSGRDRQASHEASKQCQMLTLLLDSNNEYRKTNHELRREICNGTRSKCNSTRHD